MSTSSDAKKARGQSGKVDKADDKTGSSHKSERADTKDKSGKTDSGSLDRTDDKSSSKTQSQSKSKDKSNDRSPEKDKSKDKSQDKDRSQDKSSSKSLSKSQDKSQEKSHEKSQDRSKDKSKESQEKSPEKIEEKSTPKEGSLREGSLHHGDVKSDIAGQDRGAEGIFALPEMHSLRLMYDNAMLNVRNRQLQWLMSELKQEHLITVQQVGRLRKRRGLFTGPTAAMVDRAVSATLIGTDGATADSSGVRLDDSRYANLTAVVVNIEDKGISAQDESLYALGRVSKGSTKKCKHMAGPQDDINWEELQSRLLPAFYTF